jgi:DNA helicase HerA-like ATPase
VQLFEKESKNACVKIASAGRGKGIEGVYISQRPQKIDNTLLDQSEEWVIFKVNLQKQYFESYNLPYEEIERILFKSPKYGYVVYDFNEVKGVYTV